MHDPDAKAVGGAAIACVATVLLLILLAQLGYIASPDVAYLSVVFVTIAVFLILSGRLAKFSGGGFSIELREAANAPAESGDISDPNDDFSIAQKGDLSDLSALTQVLKDGDFVAIRLRLRPFKFRLKVTTDAPSEGERGPYLAEVIRRYIEAISAITPNSFVVVVSPDGQFIGAMEAIRFSKLGEQQLTQFVGLVNAGSEDALRQLGFLRQESAPSGIANKQALEIMRKRKTSFIVLVDDSKRPVRITTRGQVLERLVLALAH